MGVGLTLSFVLGLFLMRHLDLPQQDDLDVLENPGVTGVTGSTAQAGSPIRPIYRHSIVAGGVRSADEVEQAMRRDPVVADHYAAVRTADLREEQVKEPTLVHASYRIGDKVFWTKRKLRLQPGEKILTDGTTTIRERCGNLLTVEPLAPALDTLIDEPLAPEFDVAVAPWTPGAGYRLGSPPALDSAMPPGPGNPPQFGVPIPRMMSVPPGAPVPPVSDPPVPTDPPTDPPVPTYPRVPTYPPVPSDPPGPPRDPRSLPKDPPFDPPEVTPFSVTEDPPVPVPEPATWVLLSIGLVFVIVRSIGGRRRAAGR
jgi:hypothetical protein